MTQNEKLTFTLIQNTENKTVNWFAAGFRQALLEHGHAYKAVGNGNGKNGKTGQDDTGSTTQSILRVDTPVGFVINLADAQHPRRIHRHGQGTFVISVLEAESKEELDLKEAYPYVLKTLSNVVVFLRPENKGVRAHFITPELGHYQIAQHNGDAPQFFEEVYNRLAPLATCRLMIQNVYDSDLPEALWNGDAATEALMQLGKRIDAAGLLPSPFPLEEYLSSEDMRHIKRLYGLGGLSYGNLSTRAIHDPTKFWISASGVNKGNLQVIGRDILLVKGFDAERQAILLSVPPNIEPRHASVDTIEHVMIYREHPSVGAILHVHSWWSDPVPVTQTNYPCGTIEVATEVANLVRQANDPAQAIIGLKNHGLTITGTSIADILDRTLGKIVPQVPMA